jgi:S-methylmethionine-dependent homocysteine/selenocysteine methylase
MSSDYTDRKTLATIEFQSKLLDAQVWYSCLNCCHFDHTNELCTLFNQHPPARIIVLACKDYMMDIPF